MRKTTPLFTQLALVIIMCLASNETNAQTQGIRLSNEVRQFTLYVPEGIEKTDPTALVISLHGSGMTALEHMFYTEMNKTADKKGFIVAYPQGKNNDWNVGFDQEYDSGNDVEFIDSLINKIKKHYHIKDQEVFAVGLSRGGFFAQRLATDLPDAFTAIASIGAPISDKVIERFPEQTNTGFLLAHGTADQIVAFNGKKGAYSSAEETINFWKAKLNLNQKAKVTKHNSREDATQIELEEFCGKKKVVFLKIIEGGHTWPNASDFNVGFPLGRTTHDLDFNAFLWEFFQGNLK
ncbi:polyhydroxybutyrate depolymerase [Roseivirga ehrenbergii]|uniref:Esterase n=1 Tax=Roseivirga ehrenbergii (strain DSM 102268 / JCM 13514 / KCTC 12282 / NCIMB 14502 / KMM 6017) TaxID=279360 RepID=A0A150XSI1_ROSEK|nr:PHB depolymerase family esterase [Roseivirga ehrenbergii]KYG81700.1 hypothetical protein MB14_14055 [Roseivirga ehrenbergii]TCL10877.1 polyhydroxybutyrate depolymerase [Roseivirga ehrenbergii]